MIIKKAYIVGAMYSASSIDASDWKIKGISSLKYKDDGLGLFPIRRIK